MIVLGIDPGYALMGWGVVEAQGDRGCACLDCGCVETQAGVPMQHRLRRTAIGCTRPREHLSSGRRGV